MILLENSAGDHCHPRFLYINLFGDGSSGCQLCTCFCVKACLACLCMLFFIHLLFLSLFEFCCSSPEFFTKIPRVVF